MVRKNGHPLCMAIGIVNLLYYTNLGHHVKSNIRVCSFVGTVISVFEAYEVGSLLHHIQPHIRRCSCLSFWITRDVFSTTPRTHLKRGCCCVCTGLSVFEANGTCWRLYHVQTHKRGLPCADTGVSVFEEHGRCSRLVSTSIYWSAIWIGCDMVCTRCKEYFCIQYWL